MQENARRRFLVGVGRGMLVASLGPGVCSELSLAAEAAGDDAGELSFGELEALVASMENSEPDELLPRLVREIRAGTGLRRLVAAAALANARACGGEDYVGFHAFMALMPAYEMSLRLPDSEKPLPVLKVLYRNTARLRERGGRRADVLRAAAPGALAAGASPPEALRRQVLSRDVDGAEAAFATIAGGPPRESWGALLSVVRDDVDVHRIVLAWRAWDTLRLAGEKHAHTLLRQSVRFCVRAEAERVRRGLPEPGIRSVLPPLLESLDRRGGPKARRRPEDAALGDLSAAVFASEPAAAAEAVADALAAGWEHESVGEAISLAANRLLLHDPGRERGLTPDKPRGSVHGASTGVHASDAANAWRNVARAAEPRSAAASLIAAAYHTAGRSSRVGAAPIPFREVADETAASGGEALLGAAGEAIRGGEQVRASGLIERYGALGHPHEPAFRLLQRFALSEDGALHAEKYCQTVAEEFERTRPAFRWRHLVGLARVSASQYGWPAPGLAEARRLLRLEAAAG